MISRRKARLKQHTIDTAIDDYSIIIECMVERAELECLYNNNSSE